jgi:hypothetical protein
MLKERLELANLLETSPLQKNCLIGFDGFIDEIVLPLEQLHQPFRSIESFGARIQSFAGKSGNIELEVKRRKIGGNGPILANALLLAGFSTEIVGALGKPAIDPLFEEFRKRGATLHSYAPCGHSDCLEFPEGKIILGKMGGQNLATAEEVIAAVPNLLDALDRADLFASVNWTMLPMMNRLWSILLKAWLPRITQKKRLFFVDLADPAKRSDADLHEALQLLERLGAYYAVHLGLNRREAERVATIKKVAPWDGNEPPSAFVRRLKKTLKIHNILFHAPSFAANDSHDVESLLVTKPQLSTGAGDNFNAGYLHGKLLECSDRQALLLGVFTAGFYVRQGKSPDREELALFLKEEIN